MSSAIGSILILLICCVFFVIDKWPAWVIAMAGCTLTAILGYTTWNEAFGAFANSTTFLLFGMQILGLAMFESGAARLIGEQAIKLARGNTKALLTIGVIVSVGLSAFLSNTAVTATMLAIFGAAALNSNDLQVKDFFMPLTVASIAGGICTLVGSTPQATTQALLTEAGLEGFKIFDYAYVGVPCAIVLVIFCLTFSLPIGRKTWGKRYEENVDPQYSKEALALEGNKVIEYDKKRVVTAFAIFFGTIVLFVADVFSIGVTCVLSATLCLLTGIISPKVAFQKMSWPIIYRYGFTIGFCKAVEVTGGGALIANSILDLFGDALTPWLLFVTVTILCCFMSTFMANSTPLAIIFPILLSLQPLMNLDLHAYMMAMTVAVNLAFCSPLGNAQSTMALQAGYRFGDYIKWGWAPQILMVVLMVFLTPIFFPLTLG